MMRNRHADAQRAAIDLQLIAFVHPSGWAEMAGDELMTDCGGCSEAA
jgi:hypothetical protein